jgi:hypothetical protein
MSDDKPRLIKPSSLAELKAQNADLRADISALRDDIAALRLDVERHRITLNLILAGISQLTDPNKITCPF